MTIGGCDTVELAAKHQTPLYVFDEDTIRGSCQDFVQYFGEFYEGNVEVLYAAKAYAGLWISKVVHSEGLGMDVVSLGELLVALRAGVPASKIYFHGNNKSAEELRWALQEGVGRIVVDSLDEFSLLDGILAERNLTQEVLLRINPATFHAETHSYTSTGVQNGKFGLEVLRGDDWSKWDILFASPRIRVIGLHMHLGSPIWSGDPYKQAIEKAIDLAENLRARYRDFELKEFSPGGGFAVQYTQSTPAPPIRAYAEVISNALRDACHKARFELPKLILEPGRAIVGRAGVALYSVGTMKVIPRLRNYASVDGGMADNIRPMLYDASYEAIVANKLDDGQSEHEYYRVIGKYCESGDVVIPEIGLPPLTRGDILAIPAAGAYSIPMASNYNCAFKPAIVGVKDGRDYTIRRRENIDDLLRTEVEAQPARGHEED